MFRSERAHKSVLHTHILYICIINRRGDPWAIIRQRVVMVGATMTFGGTGTTVASVQNKNTANILWERPLMGRHAIYYIPIHFHIYLPTFFPL